MISDALGKLAVWKDIPNDDVLFNCLYPFWKGAPPLWHHDGKRMLGVKYSGRWIVVWHPGHMSDAWKYGHSGITRELVKQSYEFGTNLISYSYTHAVDFHRRAEQLRSKQK